MSAFECDTRLVGTDSIGFLKHVLQQMSISELRRLNLARKEKLDHESEMLRGAWTLHRTVVRSTLKIFLVCSAIMPREKSMSTRTGDRKNGSNPGLWSLISLIVGSFLV